MPPSESPQIVKMAKFELERQDVEADLVEDSFRLPEEPSSFATFSINEVTRFLFCQVQMYKYTVTKAERTLSLL